MQKASRISQRMALDESESQSGAAPITNIRDLSPASGTRKRPLSAQAKRDAERFDWLIKQLGTELTSVIVGTDSPRLESWAIGRTKAEKAAVSAAEQAADIVRFLQKYESSETIKAWLVGRNTVLEGKSPAETIASDPDAVQQAAKRLAYYG